MSILSHRFAKCEFCVTWRKASEDPARKYEAMVRLRAHRQWAHVRERAKFEAKKRRAKGCPDFISVSMDGTDKFPHGFPHFWETSKSDGKGDRLKLHIDIAMVHGSTPRIYVATENVRY